MPSSRLNPLDVAESDPAVGVVALHGPSQRGIALTNETLGKAEEWAARGDVSFHLSHFVTCPNRAAHKRQRELGDDEVPQG
jgi:hypothetical protein